MRTKIDYGIDLGTTNSAIARMENGKPVIRKSDNLMDTTPSCVSITKKKDFLVGVSAISVMRIDNTRALKNWEKGNVNTYIEFKRMMGSKHSEQSSNLGHSITPEELSAEVLKKIKSYITDENVNSVVITVPAMFDAVKKDATVNAAKLAGFKHIELLQEPVAAVTAYGLQTSKKNGYWLVFDFGGGTFDAALVKAEDGILAVKDTAGNNWLGGKNLDYAIVDEIIIPYLKEKYVINFIMDDENKLKILRDALKPFAEEIKNQLSFRPEYSFLSNLGDLPFEDENGEEPEIDIVVSQKDIEKVLSPIFQKAIDITKDVLKNNNLKGSDIDALILVGGPTYSPILRNMLKEQITEKVDTSIDPMTAVATGAALFASTISVSEEVKENSRDKTKLQLGINYSATSVEYDEMINVQILKDKTNGTIPNKVYIEIIRGAGDWSSGRKLINSEKKTILDVVLIDGSNQFEVNAFDEHGNRIECQPSSFNILQGIGGLDSLTTLPYNIGIAKYFRTEEKDLFLSVPGLERTKRVPATGVRNDLKTRRTIRPGKVEDIIRIPVYMGERNADGTNPLLNKWVYDVIISGETIPKLLPEGSDVEITIKVDRSEKMQFSAYFPLIDHTEELEIDIKSPELPDTEYLKTEINNAKKTAKKVNDLETFSNLENLETDVEKSGVTADGKLQIMDNLRKELLKLEEAEKITEWPKVEEALKESFFELEDLIEKIKIHSNIGNLNMKQVEAHLEEYRKKVEHIVKDKNIKDAKELTSEIGQLDFELRNAVTDNAMDIQFLRHLNDDFGSYHWKDANKARQLLNQGLQMATNGNTSGIRTILVQLISLMPDDEKPKETLG
ncbi:MAG: Hsp70 family protein [Bacteroidetes bacterium]|nr:Hsp70 family protein [Bacteroidota bacterium]